MYSSQFYKKYFLFSQETSMIVITSWRLLGPSPSWSYFLEFRNLREKYAFSDSDTFTSATKSFIHAGRDEY